MTGVARMVRTVVLLALAIPDVAEAQHPAQDGARGARRISLEPGTFIVSGTPVSVDEGRFVVPANRASGSAPSLALAFVRFASTASTPGSPIVFLAGGPGDAATRALRGMPLDFLNELRSIADVIAFDQRGTGLSEPRNVMCPPAPILARDRPLVPSEVLDTLRRRVRDCLADSARRGVDVGGLTTAESADDLEALRVVLGARQLTFLAGSYGTHLALAAARRHPALVDRMVLVGVEGPDDTFKLPARVDSVLATIAAARRPTLLDDIRTLRTRLAAAPLPFTFSGGQVIQLGEWELQRWVAESLDEVREIDAMVAAVPAMLGGQFAALGAWSLRYRFPRALTLMNLAMDCASYASPERLTRIRREASSALLGNAIDFPLPDLCDVPGLPRLPETSRAPQRVEVPALLVSGTFDGRTPVANAIEVGRSLPRSRMLVVDGASHGLFREAVVMKGILAFFREPSP